MVSSCFLFSAYQKCMIGKSGTGAALHHPVSQFQIVSGLLSIFYYCPLAIAEHPVRIIFSVS